LGRIEKAEQHLATAEMLLGHDNDGARGSQDLTNLRSESPEVPQCPQPPALLATGALPSGEMNPQAS
jgi:hypothetical protein